MNPVCLDTSGYSALMKGEADVARVLESAESILVPAIVLGELYAGFAMGLQRDKNHALLSEFLEQPGCRVVEIGREVAERYGEIVRVLRNQGTPIPTNDIWIAAVTIHFGASLVSNDERFKSVPLLPVLP